MRGRRQLRRPFSMGVRERFALAALALPGSGWTQVASANIVAGQVTNARTGAAMARVLVQANNHAVFTDGEGRFQIADTTPISSVQITRPGFALSPEQRDPSMISINANVLSTALEIALWPEAILVGSVTSTDGEPLPRILVIAQRSIMQNGALVRQVAGFATTNAHGTFRLPVPEGDYTIETRFSPPDFSRGTALLPSSVPASTANEATSTLHVSSGTETRIDLHPQMAPVHRFTLPMVEADMDTSISVRSGEEPAFQPSRHTEADGVGLDLPAGTYHLLARAAGPSGPRAAVTSIVVPDHDAVGPTLHLDPLPSIPVEITSDTADLANAGAGAAPSVAALNLRLQPASSLDGSGEVGSRPSNRTGGRDSFSVIPGAYRLFGGEGSPWTILSATFGGIDLMRQPLVVAPNTGSEPIRLVVSRGSGTLTGLTRIGGVPASCWVVVVSSEGHLPKAVLRRTDASGRFNLAGLAPDTYRLVALPLWHSADFSDPAVLDQYQAYIQTATVTASSAPPLTLEAVPVHELYP